MDLYTNNGVYIQLVNTCEEPTVRQRVVFKDPKNILTIPNSIVQWLRSSPESKDYADQYSIYTQADNSNIILTITIVREKKPSYRGAVVVNLVYNERQVIDTATAFDFEIMPDTNTVNLLGRKISYMLDIILGYNSLELFNDADKWFKINTV